MLSPWREGEDGAVWSVRLSGQILVSGGLITVLVVLIVNLRPQHKRAWVRAHTHNPAPAHACAPPREVGL